MDDEFIIGAVVIVGCLLIVSVGVYMANYEAHCVYENYSVNITGHYDKEYTTMVAMSNGKTTTCVPVFHHDYYIIADNHTLKVPLSFWKNMNINDTVQLTKNLNNSNVKINYDYYET